MSDPRYEVRITDNDYGANIVEVVIGRRTERGLLVERVEPASVDQAEGEPFQTYVTWHATQRLIEPSLNRQIESFPVIQQDPVSLRILRPQVRALAQALLKYADEMDGVPPVQPDADKVPRADLEHERARTDRLLDTVLEQVRTLTAQRAAGPAAPAHEEPFGFR